jgi:hypothetical protein
MHGDVALFQIRGRYDDVSAAKQIHDAVTAAA